MNKGDYEAVSEATTREEFRHSLSRFADRMGFPLVNALLVYGDLDSPDLRIGSIGNTPASFLESHANVRRIRVDPVMHRLMEPMPFSWDLSFYAQAGKGHLWEEGAPYGYRFGVAASLAVGDKQRVCVGVDRHEKLPTSTRGMTRLLADLQLLAVHTNVAAERFLLTVPGKPDSVNLTAHQLQVLRLIAEGKSSKTIGQLLSKSPDTVQFHVKSLFAKLGVATREQAVMAACRLRILQ